MSLEKIANLAGVSATTVSVALRNGPGVNSATRERIVRIARDLGYAPNAAASSLACGKARLIGVAPYTVSEGCHIGPCAAAIIDGLSDSVHERGMDVVLISDEGQTGVPRLLSQRAVGGVMISSFPHPRLLEWLKATSLPCVGVNLGLVSDMDCVHSDSAGGVHQAIEHLAALGHRRIAYINTDIPPGRHHAPTAGMRLHGFLTTVAERGLIASPGSEIHCDVRERISALFANGHSPTAFMCYNDDIAMVAVQALAERGLRVGPEVSVVGIDDNGSAELTNPPLATVHVPFAEMGRRGGELLLSRIDEPERPLESIELPETLVIRKSTGPAPRN